MFKQGNLGSWLYTAQVALPAFFQNVQQIDATVTQLLTELVGVATVIERLEGKVEFQSDQGIPRMGTVTLGYYSPVLKNPSATPDAIDEDTEFLTARLAQQQIAATATINVNRGYVCITLQPIKVGQF